MTRPISRIPAILKIVAAAWIKNPDMRLGQLMDNAGINFYTEDLTSLVEQFNTVYGTSPTLWGTYGINGDEPLHYLELEDMSTDHMLNCIKEGHAKGKTREIFIEEYLRRNK